MDFQRKAKEVVEVVDKAAEYTGFEIFVGACAGQVDSRGDKAVLIES